MNKNIILGLLFCVATFFMIGFSYDYVSIRDDSGNGSAVIDSLTSTLGIIDVSEYEQNKGNHYFIKTWIESTGDGDQTFFMFTSPNIDDAEIHAKLRAIYDADFTTEIWEDCEVSNNGTEIFPVNNNRNSANTCYTKAYLNPTISNAGTLIWSSRTGGSKSPIGVDQGMNYGIIAKANTNYCFNITHNVAGTHYADLNAFFYENGAN